jgi:hypothetical protein
MAGEDAPESVAAARENCGAHRWELSHLLRRAMLSLPGAFVLMIELTQADGQPEGTLDAGGI